ncbi:MAG: primosomal protein N', partial [Bacteroidaceae bacterium]|nr:primosomal protein N' [Bacteroidaceae bacterium]
RSVCLLHGVTGSGKTEIYIHLIQEAIERGEQVLYLLPEIVLTAQLTERLRRVFGSRLGVYHSRYPDAERVEVYQKMLSDAPYDILVGVRSSVFLPYRRLGLVIIDEEHETSFRQGDPAPRYHGRNVALMLAARAGARALLGSATPSLESYYNARCGKYGIVRLDTRFGDVALPRVEVVDMREVYRKRLAQGPFSPRMIDELDATLERGKQAILFLNRRGYAPVMECDVCGWVPRCERCDVSLTYHRGASQMTCHYCGANYRIPARCPNCENDDLRGRGYGTERIEQVLKARFPKARVARMDLDTTRSRSAYEQIIHDFQHRGVDILVGTQMVVKGLDFQHVSMVGIINASAMLSQPDFRSSERAFQMMEQVAGRAGRKDEQGVVILQTMDTQNSVIQQVVSHDYEQMYHQQMQEREAFSYPPFTHIFHVCLKHRDERVLEALAGEMASCMRQVFGSRVLGPDTPPVSRVQLLYIRRLLVKVEAEASLRDARRRLSQIQHYFLSQPRYKAAQIYYEVD